MCNKRVTDKTPITDLIGWYSADHRSCEKTKIKGEVKFPKTYSKFS